MISILLLRQKRERERALMLPPLSHQTSCTCTKSNLYFTYSVYCCDSDLFLYIGLYFVLRICICLAVVTLSLNTLLCCTYWGHRVGQLVQAVLQAGRSQIPFPMVSLVFFIDKIMPAALSPGIDSASNIN